MSPVALTSSKQYSSKWLMAMSEWKEVMQNAKYLFDFAQLEKKNS